MTYQSKQNKPPIGRVLLVEDEELVGEATKNRLERAQIECEWKTDFAEGQSALKGTIYHAALIDIYLKSDKPEGLELVKLSNDAGIPSIILTSRLDLNIAKQGLNNGADYVLEKPFKIPELVKILQELWENPKGLIARRERFLEINGLTEKEKEFTRFILKGLSNQEIANVCETTVATVKFYTNQIFQKFDVKSRAELFNLIFPT